MDWTQWTFLDYAIAAVVLISTGLALTKGLAREIISLAALIGGFFLAAFYYREASALLSPFGLSETAAGLAGFLAVFLACILTGALAAFLVNRFLKAASVQWIDRLLGGVYGFLRGWAVASVVVLALIAFPVRENLVTRSMLAPFVLAGARAAVLLVPEDLRIKFEQQYKKLLQSMKESGDSK